MLTPGHRLDRYELLCPIASGGMATVWLARMRGKRGFEKLVAIKTIKTELITDQSYSEMFLDEARLASKIQHPNVAQILDLGEEGETLYLVMEYVDGDSLAKMIRLAAKKKKPFPLSLALRVIADACAGLHSAHELKDDNGRALGVVHRDVSPQNILVTNTGAAKVIDFGLAKASAAEQRDAPDTQQGVVKGKIRYLAPEYVTGKGSDRRADIWAVGICLYELAMGEPPFDDLGDLDVVRHLMGPDPAPRLDDDRVPAALKPILMKALAKDPNDRFPTALAMRRAIEVAITALGGDTATTEDVAEFISEVLPELADRRKRTVQKVMDVVMARPTDSLIPGGSGSQPPPAAVDIVMPAFPPPAPVPESSAAVALTRRKQPSDPPAAMARAKEEDSRSTPATTLTEQLGERPKSRVGVMFVAVSTFLVAFSLVVWPGRDALLGKQEVRTTSPISGLVAEPAASTAPAPPPPSATAIDIDPPPASASAAASAGAPPSGSETPVAIAAGTNPSANANANLRANASPSAASAAAADAGRPKWNYRPENWGQEPSDPVAAALAAASAERMLKAAPSASPAPSPPPSPPPPAPAP